MSAQVLRKRHHTELADELGEDANQTLVRQKVTDGEGKTVFKDYRAMLERLSNASDNIVDLFHGLVQTGHLLNINHHVALAELTKMSGGYAGNIRFGFCPTGQGK